MCLCPFTDLNLCTGDYRLPWKSFALAAFIQLFFFLKGSDLRQWCCSYVTCRALAVLKLPSCPNLACGDVSVAGTLGEPLEGLRTGPALGTASWQLRVKLGSAHFQQWLSRALCQIYFHLSSWYSIFCLREFIQTKIWFFFFGTASPSSLTDKLHNQTVNFISFPSGCHGASFKQCLLFTNHLGLYKYFSSSMWFSSQNTLDFECRWHRFSEAESPVQRYHCMSLPG